MRRRANNELVANSNFNVTRHRLWHCAYRQLEAEAMSLNKLLTITLVLQIVVFGVIVATPFKHASQPASAVQQAEPCPPPSFQRGIDKVTGEPVCGIVTGCPYGDSIPLGADCDKHAPTDPVPVEPLPEVMEGK